MLPITADRHAAGGVAVDERDLDRGKPTLIISDGTWAWNRQLPALRGVGPYGGRRRQAIIDQLASDVRMTFQGDTSLGATCSIRAALAAWSERLFRLLPDARFELRQAAVDGPLWNTPDRRPTTSNARASARRIPAWSPRTVKRRLVDHADLAECLPRHRPIRRSCRRPRCVVTCSPSGANGLVDDGALRRERHHDRPPRDWYVLTEAGQQLVSILVALTAWGDRWRTPEVARRSGLSTATTPLYRSLHVECAATRSRRAT
ncbi:winged helix-turn-helix transcriptional regulator [Dactylosporangium sp. NPDC049525]|uniref:winged helix-turn-helix transcriptional regulator n=1 Tax=Dactylosporangium sp. NPDC049525 TaxID=3154730 RepID=UPI00341FEAF4